MRSSSRAGRCWRPPVSAASHFHSGFQTWLTAYTTRSRPCRSLTSRSASGKRSRRRASAQRASTKCGKVHGSSTAPRISMWASGWGSWQAAAARPRAGRCCGARQRHGRPADDQPVVVGDLAGKHRGKQPIEFLDRLPAGLNPRTRDTGRWSRPNRPRSARHRPPPGWRRRRAATPAGPQAVESSGTIDAARGRNPHRRAGGDRAGHGQLAGEPGGAVVGKLAGTNQTRGGLVGCRHWNAPKVGGAVVLHANQATIS